MKYLRVYAAIMCLLSPFIMARSVHAQSALDDFDGRMLGYAHSAMQYGESDIHDPCILNGERNYNGSWLSILPSASKNAKRCSLEAKYCLGDLRLGERRLGYPDKEKMQQPRFQRCANELWTLVGNKDWDSVMNLERRMKNGEFDRASKKAKNSPATPQPLVQPFTPPAPPSGKSGGRHDYGTDIDDLDASGIEIMDVVEEEPDSVSTPTRCKCYGNDYIVHGLCNIAGVNSPYYQSPLYTENGNGLYSTGDYPWTSACEHPIGGTADLQKWSDNYNKNRR